MSWFFPGYLNLVFLEKLLLCTKVVASPLHGLVALQVTLQDGERLDHEAHACFVFIATILAIPIDI